MLDFAERLTTAQVATLFSVLCQLTAGNDASSSMVNELLILVRKYLGMKDTNHQKMGVLGCCSVLRYYHEEEESVKSLFLFCQKSTRNLPETRLFFYQQLTLGVEANHFSDSINQVGFWNSIHSQLIKEQAASLLDSQYLLDFPPSGGSFDDVCNGHVPSEAKYNLLGEVGPVVWGEC